MAFFVGIWTLQWKSVHKLKDGEVEADLYAFRTTDPNAEVKAIHPKAIPVILTAPEECEVWMTAPLEQAGGLQRPLPDGALQIVVRGGKKDGSPTMADIDNLEELIALLRRNIENLTEQATGASGAATEERISARLAEQQERLDDLLRRQEALERKGPA